MAVSKFVNWLSQAQKASNDCAGRFVALAIIWWIGIVVWASVVWPRSSGPASARLAEVLAMVAMAPVASAAQMMAVIVIVFMVSLLMP